MLWCAAMLWCTTTRNWIKLGLKQVYILGNELEGCTRNWIKLGLKQSKRP